MPATSIRQAPGPSRARALAGFVRNPFAFVEDTARRYGDFARLPMGRGILMVSDPEHVGSWLTDYDRFVKGEMSRAIEPALGYSLPISDGEHWRRNRKAMNPMFGRRNLDGLAPIVASSLESSMVRWEQLATSEKQTPDLYREISIMTMQALQRSLFSSSVADDRVPALVDAFDDLRRWMGGLMLTYWRPSAIPAPGSRRGERARTLIRRLILETVDARRRHPTDDPDMLNLLLDCTYEDGTRMTSVEIYDELMGLWFGGYDTTGSALAWTLALLATNPEAERRLQVEADGYDGDFGGFAELPRMAWAKSCFDEGQRFQGALLLTRDAVEDCDIGGYAVPKGSMVGVSAYVLNRDPRWWSEPDRFDPARFLGGRASDMHKYQFVMFGGGPRHCIGAGLAYLEAQFALTKIAQRFTIETPPGWIPRHEFHLSIGINGGLPATIRMRGAPGARA